jgi:hypothetical protein
LILSVVAAWPTLCIWISAHTVLDLTPVAGSKGAAATGRTTVQRLYIAWLILGVVHYLYCFPQSRLRGLRTLTLLFAIGHNATYVLVNQRMASAQRVLSGLVSGDVFEQQWPALRQLKMIEYLAVTGPLCESREDLLKRDLRTFADLHHHIMKGYDRDGVRLAKHWGFVDEQKVRAMFMMNIVSGMWAFGNKSNPDRPGGVQSNEDNDWGMGSPTLHTYLKSNIGCCDNFSFLLKFLLDREGFTNRLTAIPGHSFNEVLLDGRWCILDATANIFVETSWEDLYKGPASTRNAVTVHVFPHPGLSNENSSRYRPMAGQFRLLTLLRLANRPAYLKQTQHPHLPAYFQ